jgi:hypothetical protein
MFRPIALTLGLTLLCTGAHAQMISPYASAVESCMAQQLYLGD